MAGEPATPASGWIPARASRWTNAARDRVLLVVPLLFLGALLLYPLARMVIESLAGAPFENYAQVFESSVFVRALVRTVLVCLLVTVICLAIGFPLAYEITRPRTRLRTIILTMVLLTLWISILVRTYSWVLILQRTGVVNSTLIDLGVIEEPLALVRNLLGVVIGMVHLLLPFMVVALLPAMRSIDPRLLQASHSLGAGRWPTLRRVVLPLSAGGVAAGCLLTFIIGVSFFVTPAVLGAPSDVFVSQLIAREIETFQDIGLASAMGVVLTACVLPLYLVMVRLLDPARFLGGRG